MTGGCTCSPCRVTCGTSGWTRLSAQRRPAARRFCPLAAARATSPPRPRCSVSGTCRRLRFHNWSSHVCRGRHVLTLVASLQQSRLAPETLLRLTWGWSRLGPRASFVRGSLLTFPPRPVGLDLQSMPSHQILGHGLMSVRLSTVSAEASPPLGSAGLRAGALFHPPAVFLTATGRPAAAILVQDRVPSVVLTSHRFLQRRHAHPPCRSSSLWCTSMPRQRSWLSRSSGRARMRAFSTSPRALTSNQPMSTAPLSCPKPCTKTGLLSPSPILRQPQTGPQMLGTSGSAARRSSQENRTSRSASCSSGSS